MITLEDQIRRYATDVAGPAVGEPPADLGTVGQPRHRGRWVLVAALVVFIAGLTWVATRPTELGDRPSVDTVPAPRDLGSHQIRSDEPCGPRGRLGLWFDGPAGDGICVLPINGFETSPEPRATYYLEVVVDDEPVFDVPFEACAVIGHQTFSMGQGSDGTTIVIAIAYSPATWVEFVADDGQATTAELARHPTAYGAPSIAVARIPDRLDETIGETRFFDDHGSRVVPDTSASPPNCGAGTSQ